MPAPSTDSSGLVFIRRSNNTPTLVTCANAARNFQCSLQVPFSAWIFRPNRSSASAWTSLALWLHRCPAIGGLRLLPTYATRYAITRALSTSCATDVADFLLEKVILQHGAPRELLTDRGRSFLSKVVADLLRSCFTRRKLTTAYHPRQMAWPSALIAHSPKCWSCMSHLTTKTGTPCFHMSHSLIALHAIIPPAISRFICCTAENQLCQWTLYCLLPLLHRHPTPTTPSRELRWHVTSLARCCEIPRWP